MGIVPFNLENKHQLKRIIQIILFKLCRNNISDTLKDPIKQLMQKDPYNTI